MHGVSLYSKQDFVGSPELEHGGRGAVSHRTTAGKISENSSFRSEKKKANTENDRLLQA